MLLIKKGYRDFAKMECFTQNKGGIYNSESMD